MISEDTLADVIGTIKRDRVERTVRYPQDMKVDIHEFYDELLPCLTENCGCTLGKEKLEIWGTRWKDTISLYETAINYLKSKKETM